MTTPTLREATKIFARIGFLSFGGPAAQIALMHRELVEERPWLTEEQFLNALSFCMLLPGPEAMQLATYSGWRMHGVPGGLIAGLLFVIPGAFIVGVLAAGYAVYGHIPLVESLFLGVKAAVVVIVLEALLRVSRKALKSPTHWAIAALSFISIFFLGLPFPLIIATAAVIGFVSGRGDTRPAPALASGNPLITVLIWLAIWWVPIAGLWASGASFLTQVALFFSKLALVTFGGAYAVLAYMTQATVNDLGWLNTAQMMDGLGLAETTPGPLILVTEFVGFMAGYGIGGMWTGLAAALVALWVTFVPCFLWIFTGARYIDWIGTRPRLKGALTAITAAVVGVILNLSLWFALHVFFVSGSPLDFGLISVFVPVLNSLDWRVVVLTLLAGVLVLRMHMGLMSVLFIMAASGAGLTWL